MRASHFTVGRGVLSSVNGGESSFDKPLGNCGCGLSNESGRELGSANRGDPFSANEREVGLGEVAW